MSLSKEFQDVVDRYTEAREDGEFSGEEIHAIAREIFDVVKLILSADDSPATRSELADELQNAVASLVEKNLASRSIVRMGVLYFVDQASDQIIEKASEYVGNADEFLQDEVSPLLKRWEDSIHHLRVSIG